MGHQGDQRQDQCDVRSPMDNQVLHLGEVEEISRFCSSHWHVLLNAASVSGEKRIITVDKAIIASQSCKIIHQIHPANGDYLLTFSFSLKTWWIEGNQISYPPCIIFFFGLLKHEANEKNKFIMTVKTTKACKRFLWISLSDLHQDWLEARHWLLEQEMPLPLDHVDVTS